jgi:hypothetical protein
VSMARTGSGRRRRAVLAASIAAAGIAFGALAASVQPAARMTTRTTTAAAPLATAGRPAPAGRTAAITASTAGRPAPAPPGRLVSDRASRYPTTSVRPAINSPSPAAPAPATPVTTPRPVASPAAGSTIPNVTSSTTSNAYTGSWGLYAPDFPGTLATVDDLQGAVGRTASYVMWYVHWAGPYSALDPTDLSAVRANGSIPLVTWMSDDPTGATTITDAAVASGRYDGYIRSWAQGLRSYRYPVLLRFDMEMNGDWSGWSPGVNGNTPASFIAAWRHVYGIFAAAGASNVTFVWAPNVDYNGATPMASLYPGDSYVGMVGLDGYNWGTLDGHTWQTPEQVFGPSVSEITAVTRRPLLITEVGTTSTGGDKVGWIGQFFQYLRSTPQIRGFVWFDDSKETDWAIGSVARSLAAFGAGLNG